MGFKLIAKTLLSKKAVASQPVLMFLLVFSCFIATKHKNAAF